MGRLGMGVTSGAATGGLSPPAKSTSRIATYVLAWTGVAILAASSLAFAPPQRGAPLEARPAAFLLFAFITVAAEGLILYLQHGRSTEFITLAEAAIAMNILLFSPADALVITLGGMAIANLLHRRSPIKLVFNLAQYTVATAAALIVFHNLAGGAHPLAARGLIALAAGTSAFGVINGVAMSGVVAILEGRRWWPIFRSSAQLSALTVYGNTAVGIIGAILWQTRPELIVLLVVLAATLHISYRGVVRSAQLLEDVVGERDRLNRIVVGASDGIILLDADGRVNVWSPAMTTFTGIPEEEAHGRSISEVLVANDTSGNPVDSLKPFAGASKDSAVWSVEMVVGHRDGSQRVARAKHTLLFDQHGVCTGDAILVHDVSRDFEAERLKDDFLARVSHELRTPLTPIKGYAQTLLRKGDDIPPERRKEALSRIVDRVDHMTLLIDDVLLVARMVAGGGAKIEDEMRMNAVDLGDLCERTLGSFRAMEPNRKFDLLVEPGMPMAVADETRVGQIIANLVSNACKYSAKDQPVRLALRSEGPCLLLDVTDRGRGIPSDQLDKIFERFHRLENPLTMETGGIGLGLHITQQFAAAMGGGLTVSSRVGHGSTFSLRLPNPGWKGAPEKCTGQ